MVSQLARKPLVWGIAALVGAILAFGVFEVQALFIDTRVEEEDPLALVQASPPPEAPTSAPATSTTAPTATPTQAPTRTPAAPPIAEATSASTAEPTAVPTELPTTTPVPAPTAVPTRKPAPPPPPAGPVVVATGQFHNVTHVGSGKVIVFRNPDGSHGLRLENLNVENGPALYVYAVAAPDAYDANTVLNAGFVNVAPLKGNQGNQNYALPADFNPAVHRSISIWCQRFSVNFVTAPLQ